MGWFQDPANAALIALLGNAVIAAGAVLGVWLTISSATRQGAKDRSLEIRKAVMIEGVKGSFDAIGTLGSLTKIELETDEIAERFSAALGAINAASIVASVDTAKRAKSFLSVLTPAFDVCRNRRLHLVALHDDYQLRRKVADAQHADNQKTLELQRNLLAGEQSPNEKFARLQEILEFGTGLFKKEMEEADRVWDDLQEQRLDYNRRLFNLVKRISPAAYQFAAGLRRDMQIEESDKEFLAAFATTFDEAVAAVREMEGAFDEPLP